MKNGEPSDRFAILMGMTKPVILPSFSFRSRTEAKAHVRDNILNAYTIADRVSDPSHDLLLRELLDRSDWDGSKAGPGVDYFYIEKTSAGDRKFVRRDARGIWIRRIDGSPVDWSYVSAIDEPSPEAQAKDAFRIAVDSRRLDFRERAFRLGMPPVTCAKTGAVIANESDADVVYLSPTWHQLTEGFASIHGGWFAILTHSGGGGVKVGRGLIDPSLERAWLNYYDTHARPELISK